MLTCVCTQPLNRQTNKQNVVFICLSSYPKRPVIEGRTRDRATANKHTKKRRCISICDVHSHTHHRRADASQTGDRITNSSHRLPRRQPAAYSEHISVGT